MEKIHALRVSLALLRMLLVIQNVVYVRIMPSQSKVVLQSVNSVHQDNTGMILSHAVSVHLERTYRKITQNVLRVLPYARTTAVICMSKYRACRGMNRTRFHLQTTHAITNSFQCQPHPCAGAAGAHCFKTHSHQQMLMQYHATTRCDITWTAQRAPVNTVQ